MRVNSWNYEKQFTMIPLSLLVLYTRFTDFPHEAITVYGILVTLVNNERGGYAFPSQYEMRKQCGLSKRKVTASINVLRKYKLIRVEKKDGKNRYFINPPQVSTEAEFNDKHPEVYAEYVERCERIDIEKVRDLKRKNLGGDQS